MEKWIGGMENDDKDNIGLVAWFCVHLANRTFYIHTVIHIQNTIAKGITSGMRNYEFSIEKRLKYINSNYNYSI